MKLCRTALVVMRVLIASAAARAQTPPQSTADTSNSSPATILR